jgi:ribonuclease-3
MFLAEGIFMNLGSVLRRPYRALEKKLGYRFKNTKLLEAALTHRSYRFETAEACTDNQRLEFLGDAVLGLLAAEYLYARYPEQQEGTLTQLRSRMTNTQTLHRIGAEMGLAEHLRLGKGEAKSSAGYHRSTTLPDAVEALVGAIYMDRGLRAVRKFFERWFVPALRELPDDIWLDNPKGALQELAQKRWRVSPVYQLLKVEGPPHERVFTSHVLLRGEVLGAGSGQTKRRAESAAAAAALRKLAAQTARAASTPEHSQ